MGDELGSATNIDRFLTFSDLSTLLFTLIGNEIVGSATRDFMLNSSGRKGN